MLPWLQLGINKVCFTISGLWHIVQTVYIYYLQYTVYNLPVILPLYWGHLYSKNLFCLKTHSNHTFIITSIEHNEQINIKILIRYHTLAGRDFSTSFLTRRSRKDSSSLWSPTNPVFWADECLSSKSDHL
jgi:hypothetical protein